MGCSVSWACSGTKRWVSLGSSSRAVGCCRKWPQILCSSLQKVESSPLPLSGGGESLPTSSRQGVTLRAGHKLPPCSLRSLGAQHCLGKTLPCAEDTQQPQAGPEGDAGERASWEEEPPTRVQLLGTVVLAMPQLGAPGTLSQGHWLSCPRSRATATVRGCLL